jgi:hypothetical protein
MLNQLELIEVVKTIINHPILFMVYTTLKMVILGWFIIVLPTLVKNYHI